LSMWPASVRPGQYPLWVISGARSAGSADVELERIGRRDPRASRVSCHGGRDGTAVPQRISVATGQPSRRGRGHTR
jgi:hypothetical protein